MSKLTEYRKLRGLSQSKFAALVGVDQSVLSRVETGSIVPSLRLAIEIERETGGAVPVNSWVQSKSPSSAPSAEAS